MNLCFSVHGFSLFVFQTCWRTSCFYCSYLHLAVSKWWALCGTVPMRVSLWVDGHPMSHRWVHAVTLSIWVSKLFRERLFQLTLLKGYLWTPFVSRRQFWWLHSCVFPCFSQLCVHRRVWTEEDASGRTDVAALLVGADITAPGDRPTFKILKTRKMNTHISLSEKLLFCLILLVWRFLNLRHITTHKIM